MKKRILSVITALCLCLSLLPTAALAEGEGGAGSAPRALTSGMVSISGDFTYDGEAHTQTVTVVSTLGTLVEGTDYTLSGTTSASAVGTYHLTVTGAGNYTGSVTSEWRIEGAAPTIAWAGSGTADDPYVIGSAEELSALAYAVNHFMTDANGRSYSTLCYKLGDDIDFGGGEWFPIGDGRSALINGSKKYASFDGSFDGCGKTVSGLCCTAAPADDVGLFGRAKGSVSNVTVAESTFTGNQFVGGIVGQLDGTVENCTNRASISGSFEGIGGIVGGNHGTVRGCTNAGTVAGTGKAVVVGGIAGGNYGTLSGCTNTGAVSAAVSGDTYLGGIAGWNNASITGCTNDAGITGGSDIGGIAGYCTVLASISACVNTGTVTGSTYSNYVGGIFGINESGGANTVSLCVNTGAVSGRGYVGGIGGKAQTAIENCYNTGAVSAGSYVGGIAGMLYTRHGRITNCHSVGSVTSTAQVPNWISAVAGYSVAGAMSGSYYLNGFDQNASKKTAGEFADGTVLALLGETNWAQGTDYPVLHIWAYSADGSTITARCTETGCAAADTLTIRAPEGAVYDGDPKKATLSAASLGGMTSLGAISYEKQLSADLWSGATVTAPVDAGTYRASIRVGSATARVVFTVAKAALSGEAGCTAITQSGKTLADANLTANESWGAGTLCWVDADGNALAGDTPVQANTVYTWKFTPDGDNFDPASLSGTVTLWHDTPSGGGSSSGGESSSGGGGGGSSGGSASEPVKGEDGSITTTVTDKASGAVIETTTHPDGSVTAKVSVPAGGATVVIPVEAPTLGTVAVIVNADGTETVLPDSKATARGIEITLREGADIRIVDRSQSFSDVQEGDFFRDAVQWASARGITGGIGGGQFGPGLSAERAQLVTFLWRAAGCPVVNFAMDFSDVDEQSFYGEAVRWAASLRIVGGYGGGLFGSTDAVTREQMALILYRFAQSAGIDVGVGAETNILSFGDAPEISPYALEAMQWAVGAGVLRGADGKLMPAEACTRGQIVTMLYRLLGA